jgi:tetratricopeptide (TPR) repeat protein
MFYPDLRQNGRRKQYSSTTRPQPCGQTALFNMLMSPVNRSATSTSVTELASSASPSLNQHVYLRLRLALSLNLRRQIFVAVCDDLQLRDELADQLQSDLASDRLKLNPADGGESTHARSRLISLKLDVARPDILTQIKQDFQPVATTSWVPGFQVTGVEALTRQPAHIQRSFLEALGTIARELPDSEFNLVLWVTRPWCHTIQQSVPEFWQWQTAVFEFAGEPAPIGIAIRREPQAAIAPPKAAPPQRKVQVDAEFADLVSDLVREEVGFHPEKSAEFDPTHPGLQPLMILQELENLDATDPDTIADTYRELGDWYRDRIEHTNPSSQHLSIAIRAYEQVLKIIDPKSAQVPDVLNDIANLYWLKSRTGDAVVNLEKALKAYWFAVDRTAPTEHPNTYAMIQNNLGSVYSDLAQRQDPAENLECAIAAYQACLRYRAADVDSSRYAATQNNLGTAFWNLAQHQQAVENLQNAIASYNEALRYYDPEREPLHYAMIQNNLGTAYWNLSQCEEATTELAMAEDFLLLAIGAYRVALVYRTLEAAPMAFAATQNNLGTAYWHLAQLPTTHYEDRQSYLVCAIEAYNEALSAVHHLYTTAPYAPLNFDLSATHNNLGSAYYQVATDDRVDLDSTARSNLLQMSLQNHVEAWQGWQSKPDYSQVALGGMIQAVKTISDRYGIQGQTQALSTIPASLLSVVMKEL